MRLKMWIPGKRRLTNGMLTDLRAAGVYTGRARGEPRAGFDKFAAETNAICMQVLAEARKLGWTAQRGRGMQDVRVLVFGHHRFDPDAWYLLAKAAIDGLVRAGVLCSDRRDVGFVDGRVLQTATEEACARDELYQLGASSTSGGVGFVLMLQSSVLGSS